MLTCCLRIPIIYVILRAEEILKHQRIEASPSLTHSKGSDQEPKYLSLTTHAGVGTKPLSMIVSRSLFRRPYQDLMRLFLQWGAKTPYERGPVLATPRDRSHNNALGAHAGGYAIYRSIAVATGHLDTTHRPRLEMTTPAVEIGPFPTWKDPKKVWPFFHNFSVLACWSYRFL